MTNNLPTIDIKGKKYVLVSERVLAFNENFPNGSIETEILSPIDSKTVVVRATVIPSLENASRRFVGHSQAVVGGTGVNSTSALENAETSAVGRALGMMGIGVIESIASADEMNKALNAEKKVEEFATEVCPKDGGKLKVILSKKNGKTYHACANGTYEDGVRGGCDYFTEAKPKNGDELVTNENGSKSWGKTEFSEPH